MLQKSFIDTPIVFRADPITQDQVSTFAEATHSKYFQDSPLTFPTILRTTEFKWLDRLQIELRDLLHTDQEYEYVDSLRPGDVPTVYTKIVDKRERRGMRFVVLESEVRCGDRLVVIARSSFVVRSGGTDGDSP